MYVDPMVRWALDECWKKTQVDGNEHLIEMKDGRVTYMADGNDTAVRLNPKHIQGSIVVHSHPDLSCLSGTDLAAAGQDKNEVWAISSDKSVYRGKVLSVLPGQIFQHSGFLFMVTHPGIYAGVQEYNRYKDVPWQLQHWANVRMAKLGHILYEYELQEETRRVYSAIERDRRFPREYRTL